MGNPVIRIGRTFTADVNCTVEDDKGNGLPLSFKAEYRMLTNDRANSADNLLDTVLVSISGLRFEDEDGTPIADEEAAIFAKRDPVISLALARTYREQIEKKSGLKR